MKLKEEAAGWKWKALHEEAEKHRIEAELAVHKDLLTMLLEYKTSDERKDLAEDIKMKAGDVMQAYRSCTASPFYGQVHMDLVRAYQSLAKTIKDVGMRLPDTLPIELDDR